MRNSSFEMNENEDNTIVWCGIFAERAIVLLFFDEDDHGYTASINDERYRNTDRAALVSWNTARVAIKSLLKSMFPDRLISKNDDSNWPPSPPDLTLRTLAALISHLA